MGGDVAKEMRDAAERKIVGLYCIVERQFSDLRDEAPVAANYALKEAFVRETIETPVLAIAGGSGEDQSEIGRVALFKEATLESEKSVRQAYRCRQSPTRKLCRRHELLQWLHRRRRSCS